MADKPTEAKGGDGGAGGPSWLGGITAMSNDRIAKTLVVAFLVALFGSVMVTIADMLLQPRIDANLERERQKNLLEIVRRLPGAEKLLEDAGGGAVEAVVVELATGKIDRSMNPEQVNTRTGAQEIVRSVQIPPDRDIAGIKRMRTREVVYLVREENKIRLIVLPVRGQGYASTLYGYLGLEGDANTVVGLNFYEHGETPGLGAQVDNPQWRMQWQGKKVRDPEGRLRIGVARRALGPADPNTPYQVDGLTGATFTARGVNNLVRFWLGDDGFGPFLNRIRSQ